MKAHKILDGLDFEIYLSDDGKREFKIPKNKIFENYKESKFYSEDERKISLICYVEDIADYESKNSK
jgi:hypothetical protein